MRGPQRVSAALVAGCSCALLAVADAPADIKFRHHYIDQDGPEGEIFSNTVLGDLDQDGHLDVIAGRSRHGRGPMCIYWYRNLGRIDAWDT